MSVVIKVENLSKQYRLGQVSTGTLSHDINRVWHKILGKDDPYLKIGDTNNRTSIGNSDYVWALKDVNFEVRKGDVLGIIGRNGAGKSTLLKILSRTTAPSTGSVKIKGRVASLLEVGTGFHPELSGRDNIFLNGAILGMTKREIVRKFDEIVDFAGVERYIDTPVKRYSSGMYVRLAFAVAAHLEPDILIVDEVLAVGDSEFQKKALGKMKDVSCKDGRTVLFVSHNLSAIKKMCERSLLIERGRLELIDTTSVVINRYINLNSKYTDKLDQVALRKGNGVLIFSKVKIVTHNENLDEGLLYALKDANLEIEYELNLSCDLKKIKIDIGINNEYGDRIAWLSTDMVNHDFNLENGKLIFLIKDIPFVPGDYNCNLYAEVNGEISDWLSNVAPFTVVDFDYYNTGKKIPQNQGSILLKYKIIY